MSIFQSTTPVVKETSVTNSEDRFSGPIPMSAEVQAEPCTKINKRGKTPTIALIQRGANKAKLNKSGLTSLEKAVGNANRGEVYWPTAKIKAGLAEGKLHLIREGLGDLIELTVTETPKVAPKKTTKKAPKVVAEKAPKAPKETPKKTTKKAPKETGGLDAKKIALIEQLLDQNNQIIALLK